VSRTFGHHRYGPKRRRVSRMQHQMEKRMEEAKARQEADFAAERAAFERTQAVALAELDRERARITAAAEDSAWQTYAKPHYELQAAFGAERARREAAEAALAVRTRAADAELAALRERLAELEPAAQCGSSPDRSGTGRRRRRRGRRPGGGCRVLTAMADGR
jgi:hypothetical protein